MGDAIEQAFEDHRKAWVIRESIAYVKAWRKVVDDDTLQWADEEVSDAAGKYADYLEARAYRGNGTPKQTAAEAHRVAVEAAAQAHPEWSTRDFAEHWGDVNHATVSRWFRQYGVKTNPRWGRPPASRSTPT